MRYLSRNKRFLKLRKDLAYYRAYPDIIHTSEGPAASISSWTRRMAHNQTSITERLRKKIWGTDSPPGQVDPYDKKRSDMDRIDEEPFGEIKRQSELENRKPKIPQALDEYEPATVWDGLLHVGDSDESIRKEEWLPGKVFRASFIPNEPMVDSHEITATLHRILVEIFVWQKAGRKLSDISWPKSSLDMTRKSQITCSLSKKTGSKFVSLRFPNDASQEEIIRSLSSLKEEKKEKICEETSVIKSYRQATAPGNSSNCLDTFKADLSKELEDDKSLSTSSSPTDPVALEEGSSVNLIETQGIKMQHPAFKELITSWDPSWKEISLMDSNIKFAVIKRMLQLSGIRLSDAAITSIRTVRCLLTHLIKPPKPRKLAEALIQNKDLSALPNVKIYDRRITNRDKEMAVGRWKLIEAEFRSRDLIQERNIAAHS